MPTELVRLDKTSEEVLELLDAADRDGKLEEVILRDVLSYNMDMRVFWNMRNYFEKLPDSFFKKYPILLTYKALLATLRGRFDGIDEIVESLGPVPTIGKPETFTEQGFVRMMIELVLPQISNSEFLWRANFITDFMPSPIKAIALNACRPSIINGFRDLTIMCPVMAEKRSRIEKVISSLYGSSGKGIYEVALAEWQYETGNAFDALLNVAGTIPTLEHEDDVRCLFVAYMLQMKILIINGQTKASEGMFDKIRRNIREKHYEELEASLDATICLSDCCSGRNDRVEEWLETKAPDENGEIFMMDMFPYLVKMRCYLQTGKHMMTLLLAKKMIEILKPADRPHDNCECLLMSAMACYKAGNEEHAAEEFGKALEIGLAHGYVRLFADEGQIMLDLIKLYRSRNRELPDDEEKHLRKIRTIALEMARRFPDYLVSKRDAYEGLTPTEREVLVLIAEGMSNDEIAERLGKKTGTIKYHTAGIYKKFNVANRQQAVNLARELGVV